MCTLDQPTGGGDWSWVSVQEAAVPQAGAPGVGGGAVHDAAQPPRERLLLP